MSNWWAQRLSNAGAPAPVRPAPGPPPPPLPQAVQQRRPPASSLQHEHCPGCGSGNYAAAPGSSYRRCYDCGWPIQQSGSGVGATKSDAPARPATQVPGGGFQPGTIVGRVE